MPRRTSSARTSASATPANSTRASTGASTTPTIGHDRHAEAGDPQHRAGDVLRARLVVAVEVDHERRDEHRLQRAGGDQLEQQVRHRVGRLVGVAEVGGAQHGGHDDHQDEPGQPGHRGQHRHRGGGTGDPHLVPRRRDRPGPGGPAVVVRSPPDTPPASPPGPVIVVGPVRARSCALRQLCRRTAADAVVAVDVTIDVAQGQDGGRDAAERLEVVDRAGGRAQVVVPADRADDGGSGRLGVVVDRRRGDDERRRRPLLDLMAQHRHEQGVVARRGGAAFDANT